MRVSQLEERTLLTASFPEFVDPNPSPGNGFGTVVVPLSTGNVVITAPSDNFGGTAAGAVYLFNGQTGALISALRGSHANDQIGVEGVIVLSNGNFLLTNPQWDNGAAVDAGAVTWGSGLNGVNGTVDATNSLVGVQSSEKVGDSAPILLTNGNYVVATSTWGGNGFLSGAVTWGSGTTGVSGPITASNSLVGTSSQDRVGESVTALSNGNYVVNSWSWDNGSDFNAGAVTWGNGTTGITGGVSPANSLIGGNEHRVGFAVTPLPNGNYVVMSPEWDNGAQNQVGAVTWVNGSGPVTGTVTAANSLVGSSFLDSVGSGGIVVLSNGNFVVQSPDWGSFDVGAATWGSGTSGVTGVVGSSNSLIGSNTDDEVGTVITLSNGNYLVRSPKWDNGGATDAGAVTWGSGTAGVSGVVSAANSLIGSTASDQLGSGGIVQLAGGNYVVLSPLWNNGAATDAGAATWGSGTAGVSGVVNSANSLVGSTSADQIGFSGVTQLGSDAYLVSSPDWNGAAGAVTWANASTGIVGNVSSANSLVGSGSNNRVGSGGITILTNGNYVVKSPLWDNGATTNVGAATWANKTTGLTGVVSSANSLIGSKANDQVSSNGVAVLTNGNYVVSSRNWDNGSNVDAGAATWGNGTTGITGVVSAANSVVGTFILDQVGAITPLTNGNYVVSAPSWDNGGALSNAGAVRWVNGTTGGAGLMTAANSLVGSRNSDQVGSSVTALPNGNYVVASRFWDNGVQTDAGAVTWGDGTVGIVGQVSASNSLVGTRSGDQVGLLGATVLSNGNYVVASTSWDNGTVTNAGAVTWGSGTGPLTGTISASNSLVGGSPSDSVGSGGVAPLANGNYVVLSPNFNNGALVKSGAATLGSGTTGVTGNVSSFNSVLGQRANAGSQVQFTLVDANDYFTTQYYTDDRVLVTSLTVTPDTVNNAPSQVTLAGVTTSYPESLEALGAVELATLIIIDDALGTNNITLTGADAAAFEVVGNVLRFKAGVVRDFETHPTFAVTVVVDDPSVGSTPDGSVDYVLNVTDLNEAPTGLSLTGAITTLPENTATPLDVATLVIADDALGTNVFDIGGPDAFAFQIVGNKLRLKSGVSLNFEAKSSYSIQILLNDFDVGTTTPDASVNYTLTLTNVNEAPTVLNVSGFTQFAENTSTTNLLVLTSISVVDDALGTNNVFLSGPDAAFFQLVGNTVKFVPGTPLDFETKPSYTFRVNVDDPALGTGVELFSDWTVSITNVNELPTHMNVSGFTQFAENSSTSNLFVITSIDVFDDGLGMNNISLSGPDAASFQLVGNTVRFVPGTSLNFETKPSYTFRVNVDDPTLGAGVDLFVDWDVSITDVNERPTHVNMGGFNLFPENTSTTNLSVVTSIDIFDDALGTNNITLSGPDAGSFQVVGNTVRFVPGTVLNFEAKPTYSFNVNIDDPTLGAGVEFSVPWDVTLTDVNEAPTAVVLTGAVTSLAENTATPVELGTIVITDDALGSNALSLSGADAASFEIVGNKLRLKSTVALDYETKSSYSVRVNVNDPAVGGNPDAFLDYTLTVTDVNELPFQLNVGGFTQFAEDLSTTNLIVINSIEILDDALGTNNITLSGADAGFFQLVGNNVRLVPGTVLDYETKSTYDLGIVVNDPTLGGSVDLFVNWSVSITDANEGPTGVSLTGVTTTLPENTATPVEVATIVITDDALGTNTLSLSGTDASAFEIFGNKLRLKAGVVLDFETKSSYSVRVNVDDSSVGATPDAFVDYTLNISDVFEAPTFQIMDNGDAGYSTTGPWMNYGSAGRDGDLQYSINSTGAGTATWSFSGLTAGQYRVSTTWLEAFNRATNAPYVIRGTSSGAVLASTAINQQLAPNDFSDQGSAWEDLGVVTITGSTLVVELTNVGANQYVIADAIRIERVGEVPSGPEIAVQDGGTGISSGGSVSFGGTTTGQPVFKTFTIQNTGTGNLVLQPATVPAGFTVTTNFTAGQIVAPGGTTTLIVRLDAAAPGSSSGTLSFATNDSDENPFQFTIAGTVTAASFIQILDNGDAGYSTTGPWASYGPAGRDGDLQYLHGSQAGVATWSFTGLTAGQYRVSTTWVEASNRATNAPYVIRGTSGGAVLASTAINQELAPNDFNDQGSAWEDLGVVTITGSTLVVELTNVGANEYIIADAIRIERVGEVASGPEIAVQDGGTGISSGGSVSFGGTTAGQPVFKTFTIQNSGTGNLILQPAVAPAGFTITTNFTAGQVVAPGGTANLIVRLDAAAPGSSSGTLSFATNDSDENPFQFTISGTVTAASFVQIIDNGDAGYSTTGPWMNYGSAGRDGDLQYSINSSGAGTATWSFSGLTAGQYRVSTTWLEAFNRATNAPYVIRGTSGGAVLASTAINQELAPNDFNDQGSAWEDLGVVTITGSTLVVELTNVGANQYVIADAIRIERVG